MKITENSPELFKKLDDCFPYISNWYEFLEVLFKQNNYGQYLADVTYELYGNYSGRTISVIFNRLNELNGLIYDDKLNCYLPNISTLDDLRVILINRYKEKWTIIYNMLSKEYDALKPLQLKTDNQLLEDKLKSTNKVTATRKTTGTDSNENETLYDKNDNKVFGFNSTVGVNSDSSDNTSKDTSVTTTDLTNTTDDSTDYSRDLTSHRVVERAGNIGNRLPSEMLEKEIEFRKYQIVDTIVNDILSVLTRSKYI